MITKCQQVPNLSIVDSEKKIQMLVYPNPAESILKIEVENCQVSLIQVYDTHGKLVIETETLSINIQDLLSGIYYLKVALENNQILNQRFVKI